MSLDRYTNSENLRTLNKPSTGEVLSSKELAAIPNSLFIPKFTKIGSDLSQLVSEAHVYSTNGDYITTVYDNHPILESQPASPYTIFFDVRNIFRTAEISRGTYKIAFNLSSQVFGKGNSGNKYPLLVREISPDRTEVQLFLASTNDVEQLKQFNLYAKTLATNDAVNNLILNFGNNRISKIINFRTDINDPTLLFLKLHTPIDPTVEDMFGCWIGYELIDSYIDTYTITTKVSTQPLKQLKGPNFHLDIDGYQSQATVYKSWDDLLLTDAPTTQKILDNAFSASSQAILNIDYTDWKNFIFYSSAEERFSNFHYKMELIESYSIDNSTLNSISGSGSYHVLQNISSNQNKINTILESFDSFERWLYHSPTSSIFTHDISGSLTPWPKFELDNKQLNYPVTSSIVTQWFNTNLVSASLYDETNYNSLWWSIPEHILMDENNSQYQLFVQMIGQHFDNMYLYIKALTQIHERDEHPERGASNDLLPYIAKSFGWNLQNVRQLSDLWLYKLGTDETGSLVKSSDLTISAHKQQTETVWRRIVNNLPYLLKTKGTARSVKAMMSIYGIPKSLISIKEYGGPGIDNDLPIMIEDTFGYKLNIQSGSYVKIPQDYVTAYDYGWGNGSWCGTSGSGQTSSRTPDTYEFRFSTEQSSSLNAIPLLFQTSGSSNVVKSALSLVSRLDLDATESFSGSTTYGKVLFETFGSTPQYSYSDYLPLFDGDLWTIRIYDNNIHETASRTNIIHIARASDSLYGRIAQESYVTMSVDSYQITNNFLGGGTGSFYTFINSNTQTNHSFTQSFFSGSIQSYKEYYTVYNNDTFYNHVKNPRAYNTDSTSGSFYSLYRYLPFGIDVQREDHSIFTFVSSSQPDRSKIPTLTQYVGFTGSQYTQYSSINETFYSVTPQIAGQTLGNEKIRLEDSTLKFELSPDARGESSEYDDKPNDRNRLAVVFSPSDQINRDIANHMGAANFDEYIADPDLEFKVSYPLLSAKAQEYFQKYTKKYDINSFIRILSIYDYTFFEQIKQLIPGRADLLTGILIEPHMLQRNKVQISRLPEVSNPQWSDTIVYIVSQSAGYVTHQTDVSLTGSSEIRQFYETASIQLGEEIDIVDNYHTSSIPHPYALRDNEFIRYDDVIITHPINPSGSEYVKNYSSSINLKTPFESEWYDGHRLQIQVINKYDGFKSGSLQSYIKEQSPSARFERKLLHYDAYLPSDSYFTSSWSPVTGNAISGSYTKILSNTNKNKLDYAIQFSGSIVLKQSFNADNNLPYLLDLYTTPVNTSSFVELTVKVFDTSTPTNIRFNETIKIKFGQRYIETNGTSSLDSEWVNRYKFNFTASGSTTIHVSASAHSLLFPEASGLYDYLTPWEEGWITNQNRDRKLYIGSTYEQWYYQYNECSAVNRLRFSGCKLEGPGINIDSPNTIDGGPVVEIKQTNPNSIFINGGNSDGNLRIE